MLLTAICVFVLLPMDAMSSSFCDDVIIKNAKNFAEKGSCSRVNFCRRADIKNKLPFLCRRDVPGEDFEEKFKTHLLNRLYSSQDFFNNVAAFLRNTCKANKKNHQCKILGKACFQDFCQKQVSRNSFPKSRCENVEEDKDIWQCLNDLPYDDQKFDAAHLIGEVSILPLQGQTFLNNEDLKREYCELVTGCAYTEKFPSFLNQHPHLSERVIDTWQRDVVIAIAKNCQSVEANYKSVIIKGHLGYKNLANRLEEARRKLRDRVDKHLMKTAIDIVNNVYENTNGYRSFGNDHEAMVRGFMNHETQQDSNENPPKRPKTNDFEIC